MFFLIFHIYSATKDDELEKGENANAISWEKWSHRRRIRNPWSRIFGRSEWDVQFIWKYKILYMKNFLAKIYHLYKRSKSYYQMFLKKSEKWYKHVISKNQESIRMTHLRWLNNNMGCIEIARCQMPRNLRNGWIITWDVLK